jgi:2-aminoadipate transaminase
VRIEQQLQAWSDRFAQRARGDVGEGIVAVLALAGAKDLISFGGGFPDPATFPGPDLAEILAELIASGDASAFQYSPTQGLASVRDYLRERLAGLEGLEPQETELLVTSGGIEGLELLGKSFLDPGDTVIVEAPTYMGAIMAFRSFEANLIGVPMDDEGLRPEELEEVAEGTRAKFLYAIPDHQNPAGVSLSTERRHAVIDIARRHGLLVIEDVAYRELGFHGEREPSLWALGPDVVVQIGTFSKTFFPGVRLGWAAGPAEVIAQLTAAKQLTDQCAGALGQRLLEEYGRRGLLDEQVRRACRLYGRRSDLMQAALAEHMPEGIAWTKPRGGFFSWLTLPSSMDSVAMSPAAMAEKVAYVPGTFFFPDGRGRNTIRLAFSKVEDADIGEGIRRLGHLLRTQLAS